MIITDLWKYFGDELIFAEVTANIGPTDRIGLVGANGVGKTTLLKTLVGEISPDRGEIVCPGGFSQGYLWQVVPASDLTLLEFLQEPFRAQIEAERLLRSLELEMSGASENEQSRLLAAYGRAQANFEHLGGYNYSLQINSVATGLGFSSADLDRPLHTFSGGEQMRVSLARLLLTEPKLLVLDEPTNHLDVEAIQWLESFLSTYAHAFIVVSHDRYFLDKVANRIWEIQGQRLEQYRGNYSQYVPQRALRQEQLEESIERQSQERARLEASIEKFRAGTRARQAKSLEKRLARLPDLDSLVHAPTMTFRLEPRRQSGNKVLSLENVAKSYGANQVLRGVSAEVRRGERIALLGPNGSGKSTLLKILAGELSYTGDVVWGTGVDQGYFSQQIVFDPENTVLEELYEEHRMDLGVLRSVLARFLLRGEEVFKQTAVLSGGEKNRLALAKLLLHQPNLLLLDEPTNHLDILAREALEEALSEFTGTMIFVSHDRYFVSKLATKIWALSDGRLQIFPGGYAAYEEAQRREKAVVNRPAVTKQQPRKATGPSKRRLEEERELVERKIIDLETEKEKVERELSSPELYSQEEKSVALIQKYEELKETLKVKYKLWEELVEQLEEG